MEEKSQINQEAKPFSVLERFRQLKKEKEQGTSSEVNDNRKPSSSGTVFQVSTPEPVPGRSSAPGKRNWSDNSRNERPSKRIMGEVYQGQAEVDVGITEFIRNGAPFNVILKHRYKDFQVNEIDLSGNIVKLTSTETPPKPEELETVTEEEDPNIIPAEKWEALREIVDKKLTTTVDIDVTDLTKEQRILIHKAVKKRFGVQVHSNTISVDDRKVLRAGYGVKGEFNRRFCTWPAGQPEYLHFLLYKERADVNEAIGILAHHSNIKPYRFNYAGTKDKRAVTTQQMCIRRGDIDRFRKCGQLKGIVPGNYCYKKSSLKLGDLKGNHFKVALRHVKCSDEVINEAVESVKRSGFINYFGLQRFGMSRAVPTHAIGKAILKGNWKLATELVLKPRPGESAFNDVKEAREIWWETRDAAKAVVPLVRKQRSLEGKILMGLKIHGPNAYQNAFDYLPRNMVTLYLHSVQSLVWNRVVSRRVRECGLRVLPGDLVAVSVPQPDQPDEPEEQQEPDQEPETNGEDGGPPPDDMEIGSLGRIKVRALSAEEAETASISDVYYPLPGDDIRFPDNIVGTFYKEILAEEDVSIEDFSKVCRKYGSVFGSYRQMIGKLENVSWKTVHYSDLDQDLLMTDLELLKGEPPLPEEKDGPYKALLIEFSLGVCSYATMVIRELSKCDTSPHAQGKLSNEARVENEERKRNLEKNDSSKEPMEVVCAVGKVNEEKSLNNTSVENGQSKPTSQTNENGLVENDTDKVYENNEEEPSSLNQWNREQEEYFKEINRRDAAADNVVNTLIDNGDLS